MNHEDLKAFVDDELPTWKRWLVARRIAKDPALKAEVEVLRKLSEDLATLDIPETPLSESLRIRLLSAAPEPGSAPVLAPTANRPPTKMLALGMMGASVLAALAVVFVPRPKVETATSTAAAPAAAKASRDAEAPKSQVVAAPMAQLRNRVDNSAAGAAAPAAPSISARGAVAGEIAPSRQVETSNTIADKTAMDGMKTNRKFDSTLKFKPVSPKEPAYLGRQQYAGRAMASQAIKEQKEVIELHADAETGSLSELRKRLEDAVKEYGGKVLKHEPLEIALPMAMRGTARQKLLILTVGRSARERKDAQRNNAQPAKPAVKSPLKVTVYYRD